MDKEEEQKKKLEEREQFFRSPKFWVFILLVAIIATGVYIRVQPMLDHYGRPGLWDVTTDDWTLGPDLDPWLFLRNAEQIVTQGKIPTIDYFRSVPRGAYTDYETKLLPYMIVGVYYFFNLWGSYPIEFAGVIFPVIMFALTGLSFFLFTRELFNGSSKDKDKTKTTKANIIALIATALMATVPTFLTRTIAGIPEKESAAFFFMFMALYLFIKAIKSAHSGRKNLNYMFLAILAGISTGMLALIWGGYLYIILPISLATLVSFIFGKFDRPSKQVFINWFFVSCILMVGFSARYTLEGMATSLAIGPALIVLFVLLVDSLLWESPLKKYTEKKTEKCKIPNQILSLIIAIILLVLLISVLLGPSFLVDKGKSIHQAIFKPVYGRWNTTVAENRQPFFSDWMGSLGPVVGAFPLLFWLSFIGAMVLFKKMLRYMNNQDAWELTSFFILFLVGLVFSRYSPGTIFNGENFISKAFYYVSTIAFIGASIKYYLKYHKKDGGEAFKKINFNYLLILSLYIICLFTARGAIRLVLVLAAISPILVGYFVIRMYELWKEADDDVKKTLFGILMVTGVCLTFFTFITFYKSSKEMAYNYVPGGYNIQWQKGMEWVRDYTPEDSVFISWWDYGYWIQSIGKRATVLDGGNGNPWINYIMSRYCLTTDNEFSLREFFYNRNVTHLLIDSTDIGKYGAFSSIGSDENYDRLSYFGTFVLDERQTQETKNATKYIYVGGVGLDEDMYVDGTTLLPGGMAGIGIMIIPFNTDTNEYERPSVIVSYQGRTKEVSLRYLYIKSEEGDTGEFIDFGPSSGVEGGVFLMPRLEQQNNQMSVNPIGAAMYLSPRLMRGMFTRVYLLEDPMNDYPNLELVHQQPDIVVEQLRNQNMNLPEIIYFGGVRSSINIWKIHYLGNEEVKEIYHAIDYSPYISWRL